MGSQAPVHFAIETTADCATAAGGTFMLQDRFEPGRPSTDSRCRPPLLYHHGQAQRRLERGTLGGSSSGQQALFLRPPDKRTFSAARHQRRGHDRRPCVRREPSGVDAEPFQCRYGRRVLDIRTAASARVIRGMTRAWSCARTVPRSCQMCKEPGHGRLIGRSICPTAKLAVMAPGVRR
jgi:hypothetical protein